MSMTNVFWTFGKKDDIVTKTISIEIHYFSVLYVSINSRFSHTSTLLKSEIKARHVIWSLSTLQEKYLAEESKL